MNTLVTVTSWLAALVALLTAWSMLQDSTPFPEKRDTRSWIRHVLRLVLLVAIAGAAGLELFSPSQLTVWQALLQCALVGFMALQSPCPWWKYVFKGQDAATVERRGGGERRSSVA